MLSKLAFSTEWQEKVVHFKWWVNFYRFLFQSEDAYASITGLHTLLTRQVFSFNKQALFWLWAKIMLQVLHKLNIAFMEDSKILNWEQFASIPRELWHLKVIFKLCSLQFWSNTTFISNLKKGKAINPGIQGSFFWKIS